MTVVTVSSLFVFLHFLPFLLDDTVELLGLCRENKLTNDFMHHCLLGIEGKENQCVRMCLWHLRCLQSKQHCKLEFLHLLHGFSLSFKDMLLVQMIVPPLVKLQLERKREKYVSSLKEAKAMSRTHIWLPPSLLIKAEVCNFFNVKIPSSKLNMRRWIKVSH